MTQDNKYHFKDYKPHYKKNVLLALPIMLSQLGNAIVMLSDTLMVGRLGTNELAAVSFGNAIFIVGFVMVQGIGFGSTPLIGANYAAGEHRKAGEIFANSIAVNIIAFILFGAIMWLVSDLMPYMGQDEKVWQLAIPYYKVLVLSLLPYVLFLSFKQYLEGLGNTRYAMNITLVCCIINVVFNYVFIFGKFGCPKLGVFGAALATLVARICMPLLYLCLFRYKSHLWRHMAFFKKEAFKLEKMKAIGVVGLPIGGQMFIECLAFSLSAIMAGWFGAAALASHEIAMNMSSTTFMVVSGLSAATTVCVSHQRGYGSKEGVRKAGNAAIQLGLTYSVTCAIVIIVTSTLVPLLFTTDPEVIKLASLLLIFAGIYQIPDGLQAITIGALRGIADVKAPMWSCIIGYMFINLPFSYLVAVKMNVGITGIWMGFIIGIASVAVIAVLRWRYKMKELHINNIC